jgi:hypothetical protein
MNEPFNGIKGMETSCPVKRLVKTWAFCSPVWYIQNFDRGFVLFEPLPGQEFIQHDGKIVSLKPTRIEQSAAYIQVLQGKEPGSMGFHPGPTDSTKKYESFPWKRLRVWAKRIHSAAGKEFNPTWEDLKEEVGKAIKEETDKGIDHRWNLSWERNEKGVRPWLRPLDIHRLVVGMKVFVYDECSV